MNLRPYPSAAEFADLMAQIKHAMDRRLSNDLLSPRDKLHEPGPYGLTQKARDTQRTRIIAEADAAKREALRRYGEHSAEYRMVVRRIERRRATLLRHHNELCRLAADFNDARQGVYRALTQGDVAGADKIAQAFFRRAATIPTT